MSRGNLQGERRRQQRNSPQLLTVTGAVRPAIAATHRTCFNGTRLDLSRTSTQPEDIPCARQIHAMRLIPV